MYVPISLPDASVPTYAVLEFMGFSTPAVVSHPSSTPTILCLPPVSSPQAATGVGGPSPSPIITSNSAQNNFITSNSAHNSFILNPVDPLALHNRPPNFAPPHPLHLHPNFHIRHQIDASSSAAAPKNPQGLRLVWPNATPDIVHLDSNPSSPSAASKGGSSTNLSSDNSSEKKSFMVMGSQMKESSSGGVMASASVNPTAKNSDNGSIPPRISISQTERETIVHTHCSNFRDVVRQLTGASTDDQDLLPVTLPARLANRGNNEVGFKREAKENGGTTRSVAELGLRKAPLKLHERRKTMKNLEKLSTAYTELPLVPSPVTPLASDFEKYCTATTPTASQGSTTISPSKSAGKDGFLRDQRAPSNVAEAVAEHNYFVHSPRPQKSSPTLLNLFPESPVCSPRDL